MPLCKRPDLNFVEPYGYFQQAYLKGERTRADRYDPYSADKRRVPVVPRDAAHPAASHQLYGSPEVPGPKKPLREKTEEN